MQRLFITALACLICLSLFGQTKTEFWTSDLNLEVDVLDPTIVQNGIFINKNVGQVCKDEVMKVLDNKLAYKAQTSLNNKHTVEIETNINRSRSGKGYTILSLTSLYYFNVLGGPLKSVTTNVTMTVTVRKHNGTLLAKEVVNKEKIMPVGIYYWNNLNRNVRICNELINECIDTFINNNSIFKINNIDVDELPEMNTSISLDNKRENTSSDKIRIRIIDHSSIISKVAVIGKESSLCDGSKDDGKELAEVVEGELLGIYGVVERNHLEEIIDEQRLAMSGLVLEDSDFAQAGCLAGAQGTVLASYGCLQGETKLQIKLVDCSTSDLYWSATGLDVSAFDLMDALRIELSK